MTIHYGYNWWIGEAGTDYFTTLFGTASDTNDTFQLGGIDGVGGVNNGWDSFNGGSGTDRIYVAPISGYAWTAIMVQDNGFAYVETIDGSSTYQPIYAQGNADFSSITTMSAGVKFFGRANDNIITTTGLDDYIEGDGGNDTIYAGAGNDVIWGDNNTITTVNLWIDDALAAGDDTLFGQAGNDTIHGGAGDDYLDGGDDDDTLNGDAGEDQLFGGAGDDTLNGGGDNDNLNGGAGDDTLNGGDGDDQLFGNANNDILNGGIGEDDLLGGAGDDILNGGDGIDYLFGEAGVDTLNGGANDDELDGGAGDDILNGGDGSDVLQGGADVDQLFGGDGVDYLLGGAGWGDELTGGAGADFFWVEEGEGLNTVKDFEDGTDIIVAGSSIDSITIYSYTGGDALILMDDTYLHLEGVAVGLIDGSDFMFA